MKITSRIKIFLILNIIQGLVTLTLLALRRSNESHSIIFIYSMNKFLLLFILALLVIFLFILTLKIFQNKFQPKIINWISYFTHRYYWLFIFMSLVMWILYLFLNDRYPLYLSIIWPVIAWTGCFFIEIPILILFDNSTQIEESQQKPFLITNSKVIGYILFFLTILVGFLLRYINIFADEGDHIANGWLISNGYILYKDIFSHHPPLINYWVGLIIDIFGSDIGIIRFSVVIFQIFIYIITAHLTNHYISLGISSLFWTFLSPFYFGNLALYQVFSGTLIVASVSIFISIFINGYSKSKLIWLGICSGLVLSSDPQMIWPIFFLYLGLLLAILISSNRANWIEKIRKLSVSLFVMILIGGIWVIYFGFNDALDEFIYDLVLFNTNVYSKYTYSKIFRLPEILQYGINILHIFDERWFKVNNFQSLSLYTNPDELLFTGFFYRLSVLGFIIYLISRQKYLLSLILYLIFCSLFPRSDTWFHSIPFIKISVFLFSFLIFEIPINKLVNPFSLLNKKINLLFKPFSITFITILLLMAVTLLYAATTGIINNKEYLTYEKNFDWLESQSQFISQNACGASEWHYLEYPLNPIIYFMLEKKPISKYTFMTPWIAEIGQDDVIQTLSTTEKNIVSIWEDGEIWGYPVREYLSSMINFLNSHYFEVSPGLWVSQDIYYKCVNGD